jgi:hypothetical protein
LEKLNNHEFLPGIRSDPQMTIGEGKPDLTPKDYVTYPPNKKLTQRLTFDELQAHNNNL